MNMASKVGESIMVILSGLLVIAILSVVVSKSASTVSVLQAFTQSFTSILSVIVSPISSNNSSSSSGASGISPIGPSTVTGIFTTLGLAGQKANQFLSGNE